MSTPFQTGSGGEAPAPPEKGLPVDKYTIIISGHAHEISSAESAKNALCILKTEKAIPDDTEILIGDEAQARISDEDGRMGEDEILLIYYMNNRCGHSIILQWAVFPGRQACSSKNPPLPSKKRSGSFTPPLYFFGVSDGT